MTKWYISTDVSTPSTPDKYNESTYTDLTVQARLIQTEEEVPLPDGKKIIAKAKMFCDTSIDIGTLVGDYKVISTKICYSKTGVIEFYKYFLI